MRIAIFHELDFGGARRAANEFSKELKKNNDVDLYIVDEKKIDFEKVFYNDVFNYKFIPKKWNGRNWKAKLYKDTIELFRLFWLHIKIAKYINEKKYDIVIVYPSKFTQAPFILRFLKLKKIYYCMEPLRLVYDPVINIPRNLDIFRYWYEKLNRYIRKIIDKKNVSYTQICIVPSTYLANLFFNIYGKKVETIYCGVDTSFFNYIPGIKKDIDILFVGSTNNLDDYPLFKNILKNVKTKIVVKEVLSEKEWLTDYQLREIYRRSKILISTSFNEPLGLIPLESMSCEVVSVAVNEAGYGETVIDNKTGYLVSRNPVKMAEKVEWLLANPDETIKLGKKGREIMIKNWTWKKRSEEFKQLIIDYFLNKKSFDIIS